MTNTVHLLDNMIGMADTPDKWYDLAVVDPPYGIGFAGFEKHYGGGKAVAKTKLHKPFFGGDKEAPLPDYFDIINRKAKNLIIWGANHFIDNMPFNVSSSCWIIWDKVKGDFSLASAELAWTSFKTAVRIFRWQWHGFLQQGIKEERCHPTQKPVALYDWIFANYLPNGGKVLDTHGGSCSSRISAYKRGNIDFTGYELDADYHRDQEDRFREFVMKVAPADLEPVTKQGQIKLF
jgi:site-specific DNA-methyltransferase (adenine-specific)